MDDTSIAVCQQLHVRWLDSITSLTAGASSTKTSSEDPSPPSWSSPSKGPGIACMRRFPASEPPLSLHFVNQERCPPPVNGISLALRLEQLKISSESTSSRRDHFKRCVSFARAPGRIEIR
jgi:hypothetical protein